uniref:Peptidase metallopeptidase domain-containing protein n=1 Tax=Ditylenchus dipsaci TaxID=166011 RepID=A0A915E0N0_9BILA
MDYNLIKIFLLLISNFATSYVSSNQEVQFLEQFGYLEVVSQSNALALRSPSAIQQAIEEMQRVARLPVTGQMDQPTQALLSKQRCGLKDTHLLRSKSTRKRHLRHIHRRRQTNAGQPILKWDKLNITYRIDSVARTIPHKGALRRVIHDAVHLWNGASGLRIEETADPHADILLSFETGQHGDMYPFDGPGRILAHAFYPMDGQGGDIHFDDEEDWKLHEDLQGKEVSLGSVAAHEIGHRQVSGPTTTTAPTNTHAPPMPGPTFQESAGSVPSPCDTEVDAVTTVRQEIFMFRGNWFWRFDLEGYLMEPPSPVDVFWGHDLPTPVDGAFELNDRVYFFVADKIYKYWGRRRIGVKTLAEVGLPAHLKSIRLAYKWVYGNEVRYYIWAEDDYWRIDTAHFKAEVDYPEKLLIIGKENYLGLKPK